MRFIIKLLVIISLINLFCGCGKKEKTKSEITISVACPYSAVDVGVQAIEESFKKYEKLNPQIKIERLWSAGRSTEYLQGLTTMIGGGTPPDIFRTSPDWISQFVKKGVVLPLDDYIKESKYISLDDFFPQVLWKYRFDGESIGKGLIYGLGTDWSPDFTLFYNKDLFDKAGLPYPERSLSWDEFAETARRLTIRDSNGMAIQIGADPVGVLPPQNCVEYFSEDGKTCLLNSPETLESLQFVNDLINKYVAVPTARDVQQGNLLSMFQRGTLAMLFSGRYYVPIVDNAVKDRFRWGVGPSLHNKKRVNWIQGPYGWAISKKTKSPKETYRLLEYLVYEGSAKLAEVGYNIPVLKKVAYSEIFLTNPNHKPEGVNKAFLDEVAYSVSSPLTPYCVTDQWQGIMGEETERAFLKIKTPEQVVKDMSNRINALIKENLRK